MKISELKPGQGSVNIQLTVKSVEPARTINKYGKDLKLTNAVVTDGESEIKLTLWNEDVDKVSAGIIIKIENGYVSEFQGEKQLTPGKFGKLTVVDGTENQSENPETPAEKPEEPKTKETDDEAPSSTEEITEEKIEDY
ncbi:hypothetical protein CMI46_03145 [Candidatus Pacearchaeota archaeon]|nr:hypothetical protein [Candidatus Pacearchaeota archaeon]|tara:strand:+ start:5379 stop:5795 length:417 start_codon:yes stop_codon:yes gene_type:complete